MLSDYEIQDFTSYDEVINLVTIINAKYAQPLFLSDSVIDKRDPAKSKNTSYISESKSRITNSSQTTEKTSRLRLDFDCF